MKTIGDVQLLRGPIASHPAASPTTSSPAATAAAFTTFTTTKSSDKVEVEYLHHSIHFFCAGHIVLQSNWNITL